MKFKKLTGREVNVNVNKYLIDWNSAPSKGQLELQSFLKPFWASYLVCAELRVPGSLYRLDIFNASKKIAIEWDGSQHDNYNPFFHRNRLGYLNSIKRDMDKERFCEINNIQLIRLTEDDLDFLSKEFFLHHFNVYL